ncbi:MAG: ECF transporter S component [Moorellaceae bacterium]
MPVNQVRASGRGLLWIISGAVLTGALVALSFKRYMLLWSLQGGLVATAFIFVVLALMYLGFELSSASSREIGVVAVLGTLAAVGRIPFAALPNVQPTTFLVIVSGLVFGPQAGFMVGSTAAVVSNFFLGQGPWTPAQMLAWGLAGVTAGLLGSRGARLGHWPMALFCLVWGYIYGWIMNLWFWTAFVYPLTWQSFLATCAASFWLDTAHAAGNAGLYLLLGPRTIKILKRFSRRLRSAVGQG